MFNVQTTFEKIFQPAWYIFPWMFLNIFHKCFSKNKRKQHKKLKMYVVKKFLKIITHLWWRGLIIFLFFFLILYSFLIFLNLLYSSIIFQFIICFVNLKKNKLRMHYLYLFYFWIIFKIAWVSKKTTIFLFLFRA